MKTKTLLMVGMVVLCFGLISTPPSWANQLNFQNVTFNLNVNGSGNLDLNIVNALNANGDWTGIDTFGAFALKNFGTASGLTATGGTSWTTIAGGLNASGCSGSGTGWVCFNANPDLALTNNFTVTINKTSGAFNLSTPPSLKVWFDDIHNDPGVKDGSLLSAPVPVPVPGTLLSFGLGMVALVGWRHRAKYRMPGVAA